MPVLIWAVCLQFAENMYEGHLSVGRKPSYASKPDSVSLMKNNIAVNRSPPDAVQLVA